MHACRLHFPWLVRLILPALAWAGLLGPQPLLAQAPVAPPSEATPTALPAEPTPATAPANCPHRLVFHNPLREAVELTVEGHGPRRLDPGVRAGTCTEQDFLAWAVSTPSWRYGGKVDLRGQVRHTIEVVAPGATLTIVNQTGDRQRIRVDGRFVGTVEVGDTAAFSALAAGPVQVLAEAARSSERQGAQVVLAAGQGSRLVLGPPSTVARVRNPLDEQVVLYVDGLSWGELGPRGRVDLLGLVAGPHTVRVQGRDSGKTELIAVHSGPRTQDEVVSLEIAVEVSNTTGEPLEVPPALQRPETVLPPGTSLLWRVPRQDFGIDLVGAASGLRYHLDVRATSPAVLPWKIERPHATLQLLNRAGETMVVQVGDIARVRLASGSEQDVRVPAGRIKVTATSEDGARQMETGLFLEPYREATWQLQARETSVVVVSSWREPLDLRVDGTATGRLAPEGDMRVPLSPGRHELTARAIWSGVTETVTVDVRDGDRRKVTLQPPSGAIRVDHRHGTGDLEIHALGRTLGTVPAGQVVSLPILAGRWSLELRELATGRSQRWEGTVPPAGQAVLPPLPRKTAALVIRNLTQDPVGVALDDQPLQDLEFVTTAPHLLGEVATGPHVLKILRKGQEYRRRIVVRGDRATTVIELR